jgi:hypothetical protein
VAKPTRLTRNGHRVGSIYAVSRWLRGRKVLDCTHRKKGVVHMEGEVLGAAAAVWKRAKRHTALLHETGYLLLGLVSLATVTGLYFWLDAPRNRAAPPSTNSGQQLQPDAAPVGHRQPRADQVPSEKNLMDPSDPVNRENAALDRMFNGICRGC